MRSNDIYISQPKSLLPSLNMEKNCGSKLSKRIALCQIEPTPRDVKDNVRKIIHWMERAASAGADLAVFGELILSDYNIDDFHALAEQQDGPSATAIANAARRIGIAVIYGYSEVEDDRYYNSLLFVDSNGKHIANYRKAHIWSTERACTLQEMLSLL